MIDKDFVTWFDKNKGFLDRPEASVYWDTVVTDSQLQRSIAKSKKAQALYGYIENKIASDHCQILDCKLKEAFVALNRAEFDDPKGFAEEEKSSSAIKKFFDIRNSLEFFVKNDICQHEKKDSRLSALRRWISVAEMLVARHCYEGGFLITTLLQVEPELNLTAELPKVIQDKYNKLCDLFSFSGNFNTLRQTIGSEALPPVSLLVRDLTAFNQAIKNVNEEIGACKPGESRQKKMMIQENLRKSKANILGKIQSNQAQLNHFTLPPILEACYQAAKGKYELSNTNPDKRKPAALMDTTTKNLYKKGGLLPTFWNRKCTEETYWNKIFSPRPGD